MGRRVRDCLWLARILLVPTHSVQAAVERMGAVTKTIPTNDEIASVLERVADFLRAQGADPFRVRAYRAAANTVRCDARSMAELAEREGLTGLEKLPAVGRTLASAIHEYATTGRLGTLDRLEAEAVHRVEVARHEGHEPEPRGAPVALLLEIDREYRKLARAGKLRLIAPRRFNPAHEAWLPVLHVDRHGWSFTALFSNTARAHQLAKTHDWVIIHYVRRGHDKQCTVVTEQHGHLAGLRVVRGHEQACRRYYATHRPQAA